MHLYFVTIDLGQKTVIKVRDIPPSSYAMNTEFWCFIIANSPEDAEEKANVLYNYVPGSYES